MFRFRFFLFVVSVMCFASLPLFAEDAGFVAPAWISNNFIETFHPDNLSARTVTVYISETRTFPGGKLSCQGKTTLPVDANNNTQLGWLQNSGQYKFFTYKVEVGHSYCTSNTFVCTQKSGCDSCVGIVPSVIKTTGTPKFAECPETAVSNISSTSNIANNNVQTKSVQWIDFNGDRRLDLFLVGNHGNALYKNIGKNKFVDVTNKVKIDNGGRDARSAIWADIDNNGLPDVFIANVTGAPTLLLNKRSVFQDISNEISSPSGTALNEEGTQGGVWLDFNNDGLIDLFVVKDGTPNQLFKHTGATSFTDIAATAGVNFNGNGRSAVASDFNGDSLIDLYVANFNQPNKLFINKGDESFKDSSGSSKANFKGGSVQAIVTDYDRDGKQDIFVVNNTGSSVLFRNLGNSKFKNVTPSVLKVPKKGIAAAFTDFDIDSDDDLIVAQSIGSNFVFTNSGKGQFKKLAGIDLSNPENPTGVAVGDFNNDGTPDIAVGSGADSQEHGDSLFKNDGGGGNNFLTLVLVGKDSNRDAIGANVLVQTGIVFQAKVVNSNVPLEFGLATATNIDSIRIIWPSGVTQTLANQKINQRLTVTEP